MPEVKFRTRFFNGIGNVKVIKSGNVNDITARFNVDETVITIDYRDVYHQGFHYAMKNLPERNRTWSCDSTGRRFFDVYHIETDYFNLLVKRGNTDKYIKNREGSKLTLMFPCNANLEYIYVQETILKKVKELLYDSPPCLHMILQSQPNAFSSLTKTWRRCVFMSWRITS